MSRSGPRRAARVLTLSLSITVIGVIGTGGHSGATPLPAAAAAAPTTTPPEPAPPETLPPEPAPPETIPATPDTVPAEAEEDDGVDVGTWLLVTLVVVLAIIVVSAVVGGIGRRSKGKPDAGGCARPAGAGQRRRLINCWRRRSGSTTSCRSS